MNALESLVACSIALVGVLGASQGTQGGTSTSTNTPSVWRVEPTRFAEFGEHAPVQPGDLYQYLANRRGIPMPKPDAPSKEWWALIHYSTGNNGKVLTITRVVDTELGQGFVARLEVYGPKNLIKTLHFEGRGFKNDAVFVLGPEPELRDARRVRMTVVSTKVRDTQGRFFAVASVVKSTLIKDN